METIYRFLSVFFCKSNRNAESDPVWTEFFRQLNENIEAVLHCGVDKDGIPYFVKAHPSGSCYIYIHFFSPRFDYNPRLMRAILRYDEEDRKKNEIQLVDIVFNAKVYSRGIGNALMQGIVRYATFQGVNCIHGVRAAQNEEQRARQISYYSKYGFRFVEKNGQTHLYLYLTEGTETTS